MTGLASPPQQYAIGKAVPPPPPAVPPPAWVPPPGPPPRPRRTGLIGGAVVGVVLFAAVAVAGVIAIRSLGANGDQPTGQAPAAQAPAAQAPTSAPATTPAGGALLAGGSPHRYLADLCNVVDLSPAFGILPANGAPPNVVEQPGVVEWNAACSFSLTDGVSDGRLLLAAVGGDPAAIQAGYQASVQAAPSINTTVEEVNGPWQAALIGIGNLVDEAAVDLLVLDGNLQVEVVLAINRGPAPDYQTMRAAVAQIAQNVLAATSQV